MNYDGGISIRYEKATMEDADAFFSAVADGDYETMVKMLDEGRSDVNQTDSDGFSALMISASVGHEKIVEELIKRGCNVNSLTLNKSNTPLFFAAKGGNVNIGKMILNKNKKLINQCNFLGETPLLWACYCGQYDFFMYLLSQKAEIRAMSANDTTCLIGACVGQEASRLNIVKHILKLSPKMIDVQDVDGQTALHVAASSGNLECVKYLIEAGADNTLRDVQGLTPLQVAEKNCYSDCVEVLEAKWKELEDIAREEMEEFLRAEGYTDDMNEKRGKKKRNRKNKKQELNQIHPDYQCDNCKVKKRIHGIRYCCMECDDYDLCEACFNHVWDFHKHTHFMAYDPPQPDVFGMLKEGPGREVLAPKKEEKKDVEVVKEKDESEKKEVEKVSQAEENVPTPTPTPAAPAIPATPVAPAVPAVPAAPAAPAAKSEADEDDWTVITEKRKKNRTASTSYSIDHEEKKKRQVKSSKMNYKKAIQKSLNTKKEKIPTLPTPTQTNSAPTKEASPEPQPVPSVPTGPTDPTCPTDPVDSTRPIDPADPILSSTNSTVLAGSAALPKPTSADISGPASPSGSRTKPISSFTPDFSDQIPLFNQYDDGFAYGDSYHLTHPSMDGFKNYDLPYYNYDSNPMYYGSNQSMNNQLWPQSHYGLWRQREMDIEREQWLISDPPHYPNFDDDSYNFTHTPTYTSEELQRLLEMSNPSARATGITVSQFLGLDLDYASDKQLTMLMDMHMEAIKQITSMKVRMAKTNERQRLMYPREVNDISIDPQDNS